jgi:phage gp36-like protein
VAAPITRYATEADLALYAINEEALRGIDPAQIDAALEAASREADDPLSAQYALPLMAIGTSLRVNVARIAAHILFSTIGYNPQAGADELIKSNAADARKWLGQVRGGMTAVGVQGSLVSGTGGQSPLARPMIVSSTSRGFTERGDGAVSGSGCKGTGFGGGFVND